MSLSTDHADRSTEFSGDEFDEAYPPGYELHYWHRARGGIVRDLVRAFCRKGDTILEIGAARGHYVRLLRADGFDAYGCDTGNPKVHDEVRGVVFGQTGFADLDIGLRERVSAVLLLDVIEHIEQPSDFIASLFHSLPALRTLIITVPARQELWSNYDEHFRHFLRYDIGKLVEVVRKSRLSICASGYFFHGLYVPAWLLKRAVRTGRLLLPRRKIPGCMNGSVICSGSKANWFRRPFTARRWPAYASRRHEPRATGPRASRAAGIADISAVARVGRPRTGSC